MRSNISFDSIKDKLSSFVDDKIKVLEIKTQMNFHSLKEEITKTNSTV